jgi:hypothetical protein
MPVDSERLHQLPGMSRQRARGALAEQTRMARAAGCTGRDAAVLGAIASVGRELGVTEIRRALPDLSESQARASLKRLVAAGRVVPRRISRWWPHNPAWGRLATVYGRPGDAPACPLAPQRQGRSFGARDKGEVERRIAEIRAAKIARGERPAIGEIPWVVPKTKERNDG